jgi:hypothetical protein
LTALAWPEDCESLSRRKPGQSRGFQAKPGRNITSQEVMTMVRMMLALLPMMSKL